MVTFQRERLLDVWEDAQRLLVQHYEELTFGKERIKLAPDTGKYEALERDGGLWIFTARDDGRLVGYAAWFITPHMHYRHNVYALNDVFYLDPARRNDPWLGFRFIKYIDRVLSSDPDISAVKWHSKLHKSMAPFLERLGYVAEEVIYSKINKEQ